MPDGLSFDLEWVSPENAQGAELRATWARISISVDDSVVTQCADSANQSYRKAIYVPAYPIAEWLVWNWWTLLWEAPNERKSPKNAFRRSHSLASASEGFALPALEIYAAGKDILILEWSEIVWPAAKVSFVGSGRSSVQRTSLEKALTDFVERVIRKLEDSGIHESQLQIEWNAIWGLDDEERQFCRLCGTLGRDPFNVSEKEVEALEKIESVLSTPGAEELVAGVPANTITDVAKAWPAFAQRLERHTVELKKLRSFLEKHPVHFQAHSLEPWTIGYVVADNFRTWLDMPENFSTDHALSAAFGLALPSRNALIPKSLRALDAVAIFVSKERMGFTLFEKHGASYRFALCRLMFDIMLSTADPERSGVSIVTASHTARQKANRAFAAEFLAPAQSVEKYFQRADWIDDDSIEGAALEFGVSSAVIRHQVANHRIFSSSSITRKNEVRS